MNDGEKQWQEEVNRQKVLAYDKLVSFAHSWTKASGYTTAKHVVEYIERLDYKIYENVGDCPE